MQILPWKAQLQIDGYDLFMDENNEVKKRGVGLYIRRELKAEEVQNNTKFQESMWVNLNNKDKIIIWCIYKSRNSSQENLDALKDLIRNIAQPNKEHSHVLIMGDFNYNKIDWNHWSSGNDR